MEIYEKNFKLIIEYLGTNYNGWQFQPDCPTIQGEIENALKQILHKNSQTINLIGSGRTDSGVHALGQVANVKLETSMSAIDLKNAINANINRDIFIKESTEVDLNFNSRFSARKRCYMYKICNQNSPFINNREWFNNLSIDLNLLNECSQLILGNKDFSFFSKDNPDIDNKNCTIYLSKWCQIGNNFIYEIHGNRFLHHMVRYLVGTMVEVSKGKLSISDFKERLANRSDSNVIFKAPAYGLYLKRVCYD
tara:strand:- start:59 stop:811 length:753 start_codon:yes stop_codon:yes gene_type:complete